FVLSNPEVTACLSCTGQLQLQRQPREGMMSYLNLTQRGCEAKHGNDQTFVKGPGGLAQVGARGAELGARHRIWSGRSVGGDSAAAFAALPIHQHRRGFWLPEVHR